jgi:hypothetical protein
MHILLTGAPDFLLDALTEIAKQRGHSVSRFVPQDPAPTSAPPESITGATNPLKCDVLIIAAVGQSVLELAKFVPPGIQAQSIALIIQDNHDVPSPLPSAPSLTVITDLPVGPGDPQGRLAYWARRMAPKKKILAFGDPGRNLSRFIDVRDAAEWLMESVEAGRKGTFLLRGEEATIGELLETARALAGRDADAQVIYVSDGFLRANAVDPVQKIPLWSPSDDPSAPAGGGGAVEAKARVRSLRQTIHDEMKEESDRKAHPAGPWLSATQENELLIKWPHYDPTGEKRRHLRIHLVKLLIGAILAFAALLTFIHHNEKVKEAMEAVQRADKVALDTLDAFQPAMILNLYNKHTGNLYHFLHGGEVRFWPWNVFLFIVSAVFATPWVLLGLYHRGGMINLVGGLFTLSFGIICWPVFAGIFGLLGRLFPRALPELRTNAKEHGGIVVGRTVLASAIPIFLFLYDYPPSTTRIVFAVIACVIPLYILVTISQDKIEGQDVSIMGDNGLLTLLSVAIILCLTLGMGFVISAGLQFLLGVAICDLNWATGEVIVIGGGTILAFLDGVHVLKSLQEELKHLLHVLWLRH